MTLRSSFEPYERAALQRDRPAGLRRADAAAVHVSAPVSRRGVPGADRPAGVRVLARSRARRRRACGGPRVAEVVLRSRVAQTGHRTGLGRGLAREHQEVPAATFRIAPGVLVGLLATVTGMLVAAAVVLLMAASRRIPPAPPRPPPLERALRLLHAARRDELEEERKALDLLAVELSRRRRERPRARGQRAGVGAAVVPPPRQPTGSPSGSASSWQGTVGVRSPGSSERRSCRARTRGPPHRVRSRSAPARARRRSRRRRGCRARAGGRERRSGAVRDERRRRPRCLRERARGEPYRRRPAGALREPQPPDQGSAADARRDATIRWGWFCSPT